MGNKAKKPYSVKEEKDNLRRLYQALMKGGDIPKDILGRYTPNVHPLTAMIMFGKRMEGGVPALEAYIAGLRESKDPKDKWLINILLKPEPESDAGTLLSDVQPQAMPWLWYPRLALGKITLLDGDPGMGKSLIGADIGARVTKGEKMPDGTPCLAPGGVVVIMPEDTLGDTILPRFARAGADLSKVVDLSTVTGDENEEDDYYYKPYSYRDYEEDDNDNHEDHDKRDDHAIHDCHDDHDYTNRGEDEGEKPRRLFRLQSDLDCLEAAIKRVDAKLVYIDPIMALAGGTNMSNDDDVRTLLLPLKMLVEKLQVACVMVRHLTKTRGNNPLMAGSGSIAFIGLARSGLMVVQNPADKSQMILSHIKSNIGPLAPDIKYVICSDEAAGDEQPYVVWSNDIQASALNPIATPRQTTRK